MEHSKTIKSEYIYRGRIVTLRLDTIEMPGGRIFNREVVEHHGAVAIVPKLDADTLLMVRQFRQAVGQYLLEIPAGTLEKGEEPDICASRELEEEIGYRPEKLKHLFSQYLAPGYSSEVLHVYLGEDLVKTEVHPDDDEEIEIVSVKLSNVEEMILQGEIRDAKSIAALLISLRL
jgi:ADP-ribose pyrophosphatase